MKRLFVGIPLAEEVRKKVKPLLQELKESSADLNLVSVENIHITLKFLGEVEESMILKIMAVLSSLQQKKFTLALQGVGVFPSLEKMHVIWIGTKNTELTSLMKIINQLLSHIRPEEHKEMPHLTIARVKSGRNKERLRALVEKNKFTDFGTMRVEKMVLVESVLTSTGPSYKVVKEWQLT